MFSAVFSFRGRLNRIQYFLGSWGLGVVMIVLAVVLVIGIASTGHSGEASPATLIRGGLAAIFFFLVAGPIYLWVSFSLQARRFRDIGWEPVFVIPAWIGVGIVDRLAVMGAPQIAVIHGSGVSWFGLLLNIAVAGCLLFWPGKPPFDVASVFDDFLPPAQPTQAQPAAPAMARAQIPAAPSGFGRRGLQVR
jgi:uncharacterized membrane protein YhaH (DUF805 family)